MRQNLVRASFAILLLLVACVPTQVPTSIPVPETVPSTTPPTKTVVPAPLQQIAYDMVGSESLNLLNHENIFAGAFNFPGDGFEKYERGVSSSIPYAVLDDSLSIYPADNQGIIKEGNADEFFGLTNTINEDNKGEAVASWTFNVNGASDLALSIDMGAMGDFDSDDYFIWTYQFDDGEPVIAFAGEVVKDRSQDYALEGGFEENLKNPFVVDGSLLSNELQTLQTTLAGKGTTLTLTLSAWLNKEGPAIVFQNIVVRGHGEVLAAPPTATAAALSTGECGTGYIPIYEVQGRDAASPVDGESVVVEGLVTADFQSGKEGFFIQDAHGDGDTATSDGIFIHARTPDVNVGDYLRISGVVKEYHDLTEITDVDSLALCAVHAEISPVSLALPLENLEAYEGMLVTFAQPLYIAEYHNYARYGEIVLSDERQFQPTAFFAPGSGQADNLLVSNSVNRIKLDDGRDAQNPDPALHPDGDIFDLSNLFRGGDILENVTGVLDYSFGDYKLQLTSGAEYIPANPRTDAPDEVGGNLKVASFNVLNYFTTLNERGADTPAEFERQRAKIIAALVAIDADVVGLIEIENNNEAIVDLVSGLNEALGTETYATIDTGIIGTDAIKVAFIYKPDSVTPLGDYAVLDSSVDPNFIDTKNRPALAQTFRSAEGTFTVAVNHLKSKGSDCDALGDPDLGDGAGNCNITRTQAAEALVNWLATDPTQSGDPDFLIIGDLNSYAHEAPINTLIASGYSDLVREYQGENAYSYVFDGQLGDLDYALANAALTPQVTGVTIWHINADEASLIDYDTSYKLDAQDEIYAPDAYRSSDHDPVIIGLDLDE